jgi:signal transduction histidine kinase
MSHELRTPLNAIIGLADVILNGFDGEISEQVESDVHRIFDGGQQLLSIVSDILDIAKIEAGVLNLLRTSVDATEPIHEAVATARVMAESKRLTVNVELPENLPRIYADGNRVRQITLNLLSNAVKFTERGAGAIKVSAEVQDQFVVVSVKDEGLGIAPENHELIFERFRQVEGSVTRRKGGTGLGLPISKKLIEMHGGQMWIESEVGKGSTFYFSFPIFVAKG